MRTRNLHRWNVSYKEAVELQKQLSGMVRFQSLRKRYEIAAGLDCAFSKDGKRIFSAAVVMNLDNYEIIETKSATRKVKFPYIPGLLSFREGAVCIAAVNKLKSEPDLFIIDGQGIAHPRRLGLASHLGLFFDRPTIGCAKSRLIGSFEEPAARKGAYNLLKDKKEIIGAVVRTRENVKPVFVSVGHKCTLEGAIEAALTWTSRYRLPEPTRIAHQLVSKLKLKS